MERTRARSTRLQVRLAAAAVAAGAALAAAGPATPPAAAFQLGFDDDQVIWEPNHSTWWQAAGSSTRATVYRYMVNWRSTARTMPTDATDPADAAYDWTLADRAARYARSIGATLELGTFCAPTWAQGPNPPPAASGTNCFDFEHPLTGGWKPDPTAFGRFGMALARRYSGTLPDPAGSGTYLPRASMFEAWNEPNYQMFLSPQCATGKLANGTRCASGTGFAAAEWYRAMLRSFRNAVKTVDPMAKVSVGGLGPAVASSVGTEIGAQPFLRALLCLKLTGTNVVPTACPSKPALDAVSLHPYTIGRTPTSSLGAHIANGLGDVPEMRAVVDRAAALGTVEPAGRKELWVTEFGWLTDPPGRPGVTGAMRGVPPSVAADYTSETIYRLWASGVDLAVWFRIRDFSTADGSYSFPAGVFLWTNRAFDPASLAAKPGLTALQFPTFGIRSGTTVKAWAMSPCRASGATLRFDALTAKGVATASATATTGPDGVAQTTIRSVSSLATKVVATSKGGGCPDASGRPITIARK